MNNLTNGEVLRLFWKYAGGERKKFLFCLVLMAITLSTDYARPLLMQDGLDAMDAGEMDVLQTASMWFLVTVFIDYLSRGFYTYIMGMGVLGVITNVRSSLFSRVLGLKMAYFDRQPVGSLLTRTINDCETLGETLRAGAATVIVDLLSIFVVFAAMLQMDLELSMVMMVMAPITWLIVRWCGARLRERFLTVRSTLAESNGFMAEGIGGAVILQLFRQERASVREFRSYNKKYRHATISSNVYDALLSASIDGIAAIATAMVLLVAFNVKFGITEVATLVVYMSLVDRIFVPIRDFSSKFAVIQQALAAMQRIFGLMYVEERMAQGERQLEGDQLSIRFDGVSFRYSQDGPQVLNDISFRVEPGQSVALVGQTGSGKSTIGKLLTRAYDGYDGEICVGGVELRELDFHTLRNNVAVVHQEIELFPGSIRENIAMFDPDVSDALIERAIHMVRAEHMISQLPEGLDHQVQENGANLSAGQMQLIIFARALAHDAPVVLMDEATASVDSVTEAWIQQAIEQIFKHKTVIIVAHRLSTIAAADRILVLKSGAVVEEGPHAALMAIEDGYYANLIEASKLQHTLV